MDLKNQVCSLDLAKRLKELGVKQESYFTWVYRMPTGSWYLWNETQMSDRTTGAEKERVSAFTEAELGEILKPTLVSHPEIDLPKELQVYDDAQKTVDSIFDANHWAKLLCYLLENKLIDLLTN